MFWLAGWLAVRPVGSPGQAGAAPSMHPWRPHPGWTTERRRRYVGEWVATTLRWMLSVDRAEREALLRYAAYRFARGAVRSPRRPA
ncbi:hypothetical protein [Streptomyces sp. NPDC056401]|uniref:hypothetical protein n=1 Tax=Streptomyces sp. NPDC056401 TaxID=3345809 RepID=UPI0035D9F9C8